MIMFVHIQSIPNLEMKLLSGQKIGGKEMKILQCFERVWCFCISNLVPLINNTCYRFKIQDPKKM